MIQTTYDNPLCSADTNLYRYYEKQNKSRINRRCIDGKITGCGNCVGYCQYSGHPGFLTEELRQKHDCLNKKCYHYMTKPKTNQHKSMETQHSICDIILAAARNKVASFEGMSVMNVKERLNESYIVQYITISNSYPIGKIQNEIEHELGYDIYWQQLDYSFDVCAKILFA